MLKPVGDLVPASYSTQASSHILQKCNCHIQPKLGKQNIDSQFLLTLQACALQYLRSPERSVQPSVHGMQEAGMLAIFPTSRDKPQSQACVEMSL